MLSNFCKGSLFLIFSLLWTRIFISIPYFLPDTTSLPKISCSVSFSPTIPQHLHIELCLLIFLLFQRLLLFLRLLWSTIHHSVWTVRVTYNNHVVLLSLSPCCWSLCYLDAPSSFITDTNIDNSSILPIKSNFLKYFQQIFLFTWYNTFCQSIKQTHTSSLTARNLSVITLSIHMASLVPLPFLKPSWFLITSCIYDFKTTMCLNPDAFITMF